MKNKISHPGTFIFIGFGSIAQATLPLFLDRKTFPAAQIIVISPQIHNSQHFENQGVRFINLALTAQNLDNELDRIVQTGDFIVNLSVNVSSIALIEYAHRKGALYLDTCIEPWQGGYDNAALPASARTNYSLRDGVQNSRGRGCSSRRVPGTISA